MSRTYNPLDQFAKLEGLVLPKAVGPSRQSIENFLIGTLIVVVGLAFVDIAFTIRFAESLRHVAK